MALLISVACCAFITQSAFAQMRRHPFPPQLGQPNPMRAPGLTSGRRIPLGSRPRSGFHSVLSRRTEGGQRPLVLGLLAFYRVVVSPVNGSNSDLAPVHSLYAVQAIAAYGALLGLVLITERLIHEPGEIPFAPPFTENGRVFHYDPLIWNVFWWP
ncbi:MAG: membrane protein insertion efficiency factor YidD [bacterium]